MFCCFPQAMQVRLSKLLVGCFSSTVQLPFSINAMQSGCFCVCILNPLGCRSSNFGRTCWNRLAGSFTTLAVTEAVEVEFQNNTFKSNASVSVDVLSKGFVNSIVHTSVCTSISMGFYWCPRTCVFAWYGTLSSSLGVAFHSGASCCVLISVHIEHTHTHTGQTPVCYTYFPWGKPIFTASQVTAGGKQNCEPGWPAWSMLHFGDVAQLAHACRRLMI